MVVDGNMVGEGRTWVDVDMGTDGTMFRVYQGKRRIASKDRMYDQLRFFSSCP